LSRHFYQVEKLLDPDHKLVFLSKTSLLKELLQSTKIAVGLKQLDFLDYLEKGRDVVDRLNMDLSMEGVHQLEIAEHSAVGGSS